MTQAIVMSLLVNAAVFTVLFGLMLFLRALLAKRISAVLQYALWAVVIVKLVIPFGFESAISPLALFTQDNAPAQSAPADNEPVALTDEMADAGLYVEPPVSQSVSNSYSPFEAQRQQAGANIPSEKTAYHFTLSWTDWALIIWAAGALAMGMTQALCAANLRRRAYHARQPVSDRAARLFDECRRELGIKRRIRLISQSSLRMPLAMGIVRPTLLLPDNIERQSDEQLRHVCLHELTHIKHGDLWVLALMNGLRAVYWFNPFAWLCLKLVRADMETACDARVLRSIGVAARQDYIGTVLRFAGTREQQRLHAAMGLADGRLTMEKRVRGMFRRSRTGVKARAAAVCVALLMLGASMLTACQPTPETPPVVNKGDDHLEDMIASDVSASPTANPAQLQEQNEEQLAALEAALRERLGAPETFADSYTNPKGDVTVTIDAAVEVPAVENIPVYAVSVEGFSQEQVDRLAAYFLKGATVYTEERVQTKEEIMEELVNLKQYSSDTAVEGIPVIVNEEYLKQLEEQYKTAPDTRERTQATTQLTESEGEISLDVIAELGKDAPATISVVNHLQDFLYTDFRFYNDGKGDYIDFQTDSESADTVPRGMTTTREDAEKIAMQCLADLGIQDMRIGDANIATYYEHFYQNDDEDYVKTARQCYEFSFVRTINGIPILNISASTQMDTDDPSVPAPAQPEYDYRADPERLTIYVDDSGVVRFEWRNQTQITSALNENVTLLPFEEIVEKAKNNIFYKNYTAYGSKTDIKISSIRLSMMRIMRKDKLGEYLIVPVWDFIGIHQDIMEGAEPYAWPFGDQSYVTINAIDGSNIRRDWGY